ncbi:hypothetical protein EDC01DRAFT_608786 [Geopyxis carbonaria]|nr:hypothetical protein EDC01DRAFT_608786 [Geopyxis carbonaria]
MKTYFAYGSNLWLPQMARRCPESLYIGRAVLAGYRIHINERGYANIVADATETVEGLCFLLSTDDEAALDESEGVSMLCYAKTELQVHLFQAPPNFHRRRVAELIQDVCYLATDAQIRDEEGDGTKVSSLTYTSTLHVKDGTAKNLYKQTIAKGVQDALRLGVSPSYLEEKVEPLIRIAARPHWLFRKPRKGKYQHKLYQDEV